jgi:hypothetical protein
MDKGDAGVIRQYLRTLRQEIAQIRVQGANLISPGLLLRMLS